MWRLSHRASETSREIADRHYNRQKIGSPQFVPPGRCLVLEARTNTGRALWVTSWPFAKYVKHEWPGAWVCSAFRNEGAGKATVLIREAIAMTRGFFGEPPPPFGMVTFVNRKEVRPAAARLRHDFIGPIPTYGQTFLQAGFEVIGETKGGLLALGMKPSKFPAAIGVPGTTIPIF